MHNTKDNMQILACVTLPQLLHNFWGASIDTATVESTMYQCLPSTA